MRRTGVLLFIILLLFRPLEAQSVRGLSKPGSLGMRHEKQPDHSVSDMVCTLSLEDNNGDGMLSEGEHGIVTLLIRNWNEKEKVRPKLEISLKSESIENYKLWIEYLGPLGPGEARSYRHHLSWDENLPFGTVVYRARIFETETGFRTFPIDLRFEIIGGGSVPISD